MIKKIYFSASLLAIGCFNNEEIDDNPLDRMLISKTISSSSAGSGSAVYRYDLNGIKVKDSSISSGGGVVDYDNLGRYIGLRGVGDTAYIEHLDWITNDSVVRTNSALTTSEKLFNWKSNCWRNMWCADSVYHYISSGGSYSKGEIIFDSLGNPTMETFTYPNATIDTLHIYQYSYNNNGQIIQAIDYNKELTSDTITIQFEYDKLRNLIISRN